MVEGVSLLSLSDSGSKSFGDIIDGDRVVLVEVHHVFSSTRGDGLWRSRGGPYGGRRANGYLDHSVDGNVRHSLDSVRVVIGARIVLAEVGVDESVVRWLIIDPEEKELSRLKVELKFKGNLSKGDSISGEGLWFGCSGLGESAHLTLVIILRVFMVERGLL
jgi:hypothetical protein